MSKLLPWQLQSLFSNRSQPSLDPLDVGFAGLLDEKALWCIVEETASIQKVPKDPITNPHAIKMGKISIEDGSWKSPSVYYVSFVDGR
jgi:hypothetical protein